jgi:hypothetical protein
MRRKSLVTLKQFDVTLTTSWETNHGISGHLFEMIEYFYHLKFHKNKSVCILIADGITEEQMKIALSKYAFTDIELQAFKDCTFYYYHPRVLIANDIIFVDGSIRTFNADILCKRKIFLRCSEDEYLDKADIVLQDYDLYDPLPNSLNYKKKMLFDKFIEIGESDSAAMFYATSNSRMLTFEDLEQMKLKHKFDKYIIISDKVFETPEKVQHLKIPVENMWTKFDTYIYTGLTNLTKIDCSSRFIAECQHYGKNIIYDVSRFDKGLEVRKKDLENDIQIISLKETDELTEIATI